MWDVCGDVVVRRDVVSEVFPSSSPGFAFRHPWHLHLHLIPISSSKQSPHQSHHHHQNDHRLPTLHARCLPRLRRSPPHRPLPLSPNQLGRSHICESCHVNHIHHGKGKGRECRKSGGEGVCGREGGWVERCTIMMGREGDGEDEGGW